MSCMFHDNAGSIRVAEKIGMRYETDIEYQGDAQGPLRLDR